MNGRDIIRLGDATSHGGKVLEGTHSFRLGGIPVALVGHRCSCPREGHDECVIVEGDPQLVILGHSVAVEGCRTSCGAFLMVRRDA